MRLQNIYIKEAESTVTHTFYVMYFERFHKMIITVFSYAKVNQSVEKSVAINKIFGGEEQVLFKVVHP